MADGMIVMGRPRVKPEHLPYRIGGGRIRIGGVSYGPAGEIEDPDGWVWTLLTAMDGSRGVEEVASLVCREHPEVPAGVVRRGAGQLMASGYVEDVAAPLPVGLSERDIERYNRATGFFRWMDMTARASSWEPQARLRAARVTVLGVGGTGGVAALALAASGVGQLHCVDPDVVELSNLSRQVIYSEDDLGRPKADAAVARLRGLNSDIRVTSQRLRVYGPQDVLPLARDCDVLLLSADRPKEVRSWVNQACLAVGRPWVNSGYHGPLVEVTAFVPGQGACYGCIRAADHDTHAAMGTRAEDSPERSEAVGQAVGAASAGLSGYLAASQVIALLTGIPPVTPGRMDAVNLVDIGAPFSISYQRHPACPACGSPP
jgi:molybdopterin-synthase adenylyltransferase